MPSPKPIHKKVFQIGGSDMSHHSDASVFLVDVGNRETIMIDCGAGKSFDALVINMEALGFAPQIMRALILTHCHIDHIGSAAKFKSEFNPEIVAHEGDVDAIEGRNPAPTAASWYGVEYKPVKVDKILSGESETLTFGDVDFHCLHTPGHTPGSIAVYCDIMDRRVLFGQDIHGPFDITFGSDIQEWKDSMEKLMALEADILCEGHFGTYQPKGKVKAYIEGYLRRY
jgi:glyoxylase-like metal-dependent hydrolase (beta-lactamase superfamily II)